MNLRKTIFFDLDNCLYPKSYQIHDMMADRIREYFSDKLGIPAEEAERLRDVYYRHYGIAIRGLVLHHKIDAVDYDQRVDQSLPLETVIKPDVELRNMLMRLRSRYRLWVFTNAYKVHAQRVLKLLGVDDCFEGLTYCDYNTESIVAKPMPQMFERVMVEAGVLSKDECLFVDDSYGNINGAKNFGWPVCVHLVDRDDPLPEPMAGTHVIRDIHEFEGLVKSLESAAGCGKSANTTSENAIASGGDCISTVGQASSGVAANRTTTAGVNTGVSEKTVSARC
ncbi:pyrimidine 5'-nucleotidase [Schizosaccharomyces japonicus yFS275]|uniref:Pyrimidine 5'-nucleotidase n=1 Tax=Schizosaccharomyces japonicus (strain yFS275 / FY16936) TaxID=402676 RepID=B6K0N5_SCHJY|nr:pyrimidine 5'-nucleotidase [Schizosaccharomyces japonicus yFS275]EEB07506.2 pyrimidine 5'-nucleotidase [Schizosaccharomyces japonicus yFS275]